MNGINSITIIVYNLHFVSALPFVINILPTVPAKKMLSGDGMGVSNFLVISLFMFLIKMVERLRSNTAKRLRATKQQPLPVPRIGSVSVPNNKNIYIKERK